MNIVLWINKESNQKALANKIHESHNIVGIVLEARKTKRKMSPRILFSKAIEKVFLADIGNAWNSMKNHYEKQYPTFPAVQTLEVENVNSEEAYRFSKELNPDLIVVSGTRLVRDKMLSIKPTTGILNLHTGLSPYIKGGPNCTNWCLATKQFHLIGNTIMWIDAGIDTGNIITTEFTKFDGFESLAEIHLKVMEHAHTLYIKAIVKLEAGNTRNVKQSDIAKGKTYYTRQWGLKQQLSLISNFPLFRKSIRSGEINRMQEEVTTVGI